MSLGIPFEKGITESIRCNFCKVSLKAKGVSTTTFIYHLKRKDIIDVHKNKLGGWCSKLQTQTNSKKYISSQAAALKKAPNSKASDTEDNELAKY